MMWAFSGGVFSSRAHPLLSWQIAVNLRRPMSPLVVESTGGVQSFSPLEWSLLYSMTGFGSKRKEDKTVAFLLALDEEHFRKDMLVG